MRDHWEPLKAGTRSLEFTQKQRELLVAISVKGMVNSDQEEGVSYSLWPKVDAQ